VSDPASAAAGFSTSVALVLDADADLRVEDVTGALVRAGLPVEEIEALIGGRVREALLRATPPS
jgi:hypothetical protein